MTQQDLVMNFENTLKGGHPNSLGKTVEVVEEVLSNPDKIDELFSCYNSNDETVRLRTSNAFKRIFREKPVFFESWKKEFIEYVAEINQPSAKWTTIQILNELFEYLDEKEKIQSSKICLKYLRNESDWIVINHSINFMRNHKELFDFNDSSLMKLIKSYESDQRKSISKNVGKLLKNLS
tara:strand:+ start:69 stop:608 length:540 start_codon:yes stop_codon:yes gene_type:complete